MGTICGDTFGNAWSGPAGELDDLGHPSLFRVLTKTADFLICTYSGCLPVFYSIQIGEKPHHFRMNKFTEA